MKAITLYQPWASLLASGAKKYETRSWATSYRGEIAIHASIKNIDKIIYCQSGEFWDAAGEALHNPKMVNLPYGCVIAMAELVGCYDVAAVKEKRLINKQELLFGDWCDGRYAWEFKNMKLLDKPILAKGKRRLWEWSGEDGN